MKTLSLLAAFLMLCNFSYAEKFVQIWRCNPSPEGTYQKPYESHNSLDRHSLSCNDPGNYACEWEISPWDDLKLESIEETVNANVVSGMYTGSFVHEGATVIWNATSPICYSYTIEIED